MRSAVTVIVFLWMAAFGHAQEWSDQAHYEAYMKGDWKQVVVLGKLAQQANASYFYVHARNGYAHFMLGHYFRAEKEFEKALTFNSADPFAKQYSYWSSVYAGNSAAALVKTSKMSAAEKDTFNVSKPRFFNGISIIGGYRASTSKDFSLDLPGGASATIKPPSSMPYVSLFLNHQLGKRLSLNHGISYLQQSRPGLPSPTGAATTIKVWQVGYVASLSVQVATHTTVTPSFVMQRWRSGTSGHYDLSATLAVRQQFGNIHATLIGGFFQDSDTTKYMAGASFTWYPLGNQKLYSITSGGYNFRGDAPNPFIHQTIGANVFKRAWLTTSFTWNNRVISFEDIGLGFANNSPDRINWMWLITPSYYPIDKLGISLTYSIESRQYYLPASPDQNDAGTAFSEHYNFHSFYVGLTYQF